MARLAILAASLVSLAFIVSFTDFSSAVSVRIFASSPRSASFTALSVAVISASFASNCWRRKERLSSTAISDGVLSDTQAAGEVAGVCSRGPFIISVSLTVSTKTPAKIKSKMKNDFSFSSIFVPLYPS